MGTRTRLFIYFTILILASLACRAVTGSPENTDTSFATPSETPSPTRIPTSTATPTELPPRPVEQGENNPDEPVFISGEIPYTSPFFLDTITEAFVMLEDQGGFVERNLDFMFPLVSQVIGPVELVDDEVVTFDLALPAVPQGTQVDVDNNDSIDNGVQIFAVAYWSNTWGDPFLEERDGTGWSTGYASTTTDADRDYEIDGGTLVVWAPDDEQGFPTGFGEDDMLFTDDDPTASIPAGYTLVDLDEEPFHFYKEARPQLTLHEGDVAVNDFSSLNYIDAFDALHEKVSREYPFTVEKKIDWDALYETYSSRIIESDNDEDFFWTLKDYTLAIPDGHVGIGFNDMVAQLFFDNYGGSFGLIMAEIEGPKVIVTDVLANSPAAESGIEIGAEILEWNRQAIGEAISEVEPFFGPYSTEHHKRLEQLVFLTRVAPGDQVDVRLKNPGDENENEIEMSAIVDYDSLFLWLPYLASDELALPIEAEVLDGSGLGYIKINTFSDDYNLMAQLWDRQIRELIELNVPGIILDMRVNGGGNSGLARDFAGYFFDDEFDLMQRSYYNETTGQFEYQDHVSRVKPGPAYYDGPIAVLVSPYCISACEGFSYTLSLREGVTVVGHTPSAGAYGEVGRGQYDLPAELSMQFPTGRSETLDGVLVIEGSGVVPDILVPVTVESALGIVDTVLEAAVDELSD
ncbi:MAG: S41 family peptidase [Anaerolineales bacterium]